MQKENEFFGKKITVCGLGLHGGGVSTVRFFAQAGARVTVTDLKTQDQLLPSLEQLVHFENVEYVLGHHREKDFTDTDMIVMSPAIPWTNSYIQIAINHNIPVEMDSSLFLRLSTRPIIGVTGTKGKTTVSLLISRLLELSGEKVAQVGIGQVPVLDVLETIDTYSVCVFELSSWRLSALDKGKVHKSPHISVFKNFFPDHLNYYTSMEAYLEDKKNIFRFQTENDWLILNHDDSVVKELSKESQARIVWFGFSRPEKGISIDLEEDTIVYRDGEKSSRIVNVRDLHLSGDHNILNAMAAIGACVAYGVPLDNLKKNIPLLEGVPHRLEFVGEVDGVKFYNDTTATIPEAVISALHSFTQPVILLAGGSNKGLHYEGFAKSASHRTKDVIFLSGSATEDMEMALKKIVGEERKFQTVFSMEEAVLEAYKKARVGDIVLLSPGAASFGMFQDEFDRGNKFRQAVKALHQRK